MIKLIGSVGVLISCFIIGNNLTKKAELSLNVTEALISFVSYIRTSIKTIRMPLKEIYLSFKNQALEDVGFIYTLNEEGLDHAIEKVSTIISPEILSLLNFIEKNLGGIDIDSQCDLCKNIEENLKNELENIKQTFTEKKRMYQMMPLLCGLSIIILII